MITIKQILEKKDYSNDPEEIIRSLQILSNEGLFESAKIPMIKRSLKKNIAEMTNAEKKTIQESLDLLLSYTLNEKTKGKEKDYPSDKEIPTVIVLKRMAIRSFPDNQKIALYYSQALDKYISIPYDKNSKSLGMHLNEDAGVGPMVVPAGTKRSMVSPEMLKNAGEQYAEVQKRYSSRAGQAGVRFGTAIYDMVAKRKGLPTSQEIIASREKNKERPKQKQDKPEEKKLPVASRPQAQAARQSKQRRINESFKTKLEKLREEQQIDELAPIIGAGIVAARTAISAAPKIARLLYRKGVKPALQSAGKATKEVGKIARGAGKVAVGAAGLVGAALSGDDEVKRPVSGGHVFSSGGRQTSPSSNPTQDVPGAGTIAAWRKQQAAFGGTPGYTQPAFGQFQEQSNINILKMIVEENMSSHPISFGEKEITINNRIAKKFVSVYESLNSKNKKKMEKMLNENLTSFRKVINFVVRQ